MEVERPVARNDIRTVEVLAERGIETPRVG
jgi:hypothetical protein